MRSSGKMQMLVQRIKIKIAKTSEQCKHTGKNEYKFQKTEEESGTMK